MSARSQPTLHRVLGFWPLVFYGVGDILGAGIYALVGTIAGLAGASSWLAFLIALVVAAFTGLSYAELGSRFPRSGGEALFAEKAFKTPTVSFLIGWLVLCSGVASMATVSRAFAGYFTQLVPDAPDSFIIVGFLITLAGINFWGIRQTAATNIACTVVEFTGLVFVIAAGTVFLMSSESVDLPSVETSEPVSWGAVLHAATIAFFAFIGFEDLVNISEEVKSPERNIPRAILTATAVAGGIYLLVVIVSTSVVPTAELAGSEAPLLLVVQRAVPATPTWIFTAIALFAIGNTALLNCVMASRLAFGMAQQKLLPVSLAAVHSRTRTPYVAIGLILTCSTAFAFSNTLSHLAETTSLLLLLVFCCINLSLIAIKRRNAADTTAFQVPWAVPVVGTLLTLILMAFVESQAVYSALLAISVGMLLARVEAYRRRARERPE